MIDGKAYPARERVFYIDVIRSWASLLVVASHIFANICQSMNDYPRPIWWFYNILDSIMRPCAALFVMISGALLLSSKREESYIHAVWRRCYKLALPFFTWSMIYAYYNAHLENKQFHLKKAVLEFLQGPTEYHLWFMYVLLALYLVSPFLRRLVQTASRSEKKAMILIWFAFLSLRFFFPAWVSSAPTVIFLNYGGYFVLGYLLDQSKYLAKKMLWPCVIAVALISVNAYATYYLTLRNNGVLNEKFYFGDTPLVAIYSGALFLILKNMNYDWIFGRLSWLRRFITYFSKESYNVYLMHALFIWMFMKGQLGIVLSADSGPNALIGVPLTTAAVVTVSLCVCFVARRVPVLCNLFIITSKT